MREGGLDLQADDVLGRGIEFAPMGAVLRSRAPVRSDDGENDIRLLHAPHGVTSPLGPRGDVARVEEDLLRTKALLQRLRQLARRRRGVRAAIADEYTQPGPYSAPVACLSQVRLDLTNLPLTGERYDRKQDPAASGPESDAICPEYRGNFYKVKPSLSSPIGAVASAFEHEVG